MRKGRYIENMDEIKERDSKGCRTFRLKFQYADEDRFLFLPIEAVEMEDALREAMHWIKFGNKKVKSAYLIKEEKSEAIVWSMEEI